VDLSIVIVSWNVWPLLRHCLLSIECASKTAGEHGRVFQEDRGDKEGREDWKKEKGEGKTPSAQSPISDLPISQSPISQSPNLPIFTLEVIVVDNASRDNTPALLATHFPWVRVIASDRNLGFTGGNNRGYAASRGRFVYFLNPDTELTTGQTGREGEEGEKGEGERSAAQSPNLQSPISQSPNLPISNLSLSPSSLLPLYTALAADPTIGIIGPQLRYADGAPQPSARRFPTRLTGFFESTWLGRAWPSNPWARALLLADLPAGQRAEVDWLVGAALLCRREALDAVATPDGPFDEGFFMYSEELDLCRRVKLAGWRVVYEPAALVIHHEGKSSEQVSTQRHIRFNTSKVRYWRKWFGPRWAETLRRYLLLEYHVQVWVERAKLLLRHKPELRRERIAAYQAVLRSELRASPPVLPEQIVD
jgi:GT2 family glycosyltransferase